MTARITHGHTRWSVGPTRNTPEYRTWYGMKQRCYNPKHCKFQRYGGRGIIIHERWLGDEGFKNFLSDMGSRPSAVHSIDRFPNKDGNYEPGNCRWATPKQQAENRTRESFNGQAHKLSCPSGHPYSGSNLRLTKNGGRKCKTCEMLRARKSRQRQKAGAA